MDSGSIYFRSVFEGTLTKNERGGSRLLLEQIKMAGAEFAATAMNVRLKRPFSTPKLTPVVGRSGRSREARDE
jgi:hypothetical protein